MRLTTIRVTRDRTAAARIEKKHLTLLPHPDVGALIASGPDWAQRAATHRGEQLRLPTATTLPPLTPGKVISVGPNYPTRIKELDQQHPPAPTLSMARPSTTAGTQTTVPLPVPPDRSTDWGVQLGVVISHHAHHITTATAHRHIAGYAVINHLHTTDHPAQPPESRSILLIGPTLVTPDQLPTGGRGLTLTATLGGRLVQKANTSELHFDVATLIAHASTVTTLHPGDLITTGTPGGTLDHPLAPGQSLHVAIKGLGDIDTHFTATYAPEART
ncbi:fumarylacetoacetate hydrolase family protein [Streptomyces sp. NPDC050997]|uniref:fumarylacetoacetate hydrolase family protein n=1 Tax=Streptomyces sp. NPDC050997 TaxID=3155519 RepID=UPI0034139301